MKEKSQSKAELEQNKRASLKRMLDSHSEILFNKHHYENWHYNFSEMSRNILLWGSDEILEEYGKYVMGRHPDYEKIKEHELHFAKAILAFRKEIGYKNKKDKVTPEQIVIIFRSGYKGNI
ncbi:MAG TPA: hypothetical protein DHV28_11340 [Ignavibacteriales bacterium]|nr:hypothetical protein [Ignavibacteriales bacterium]